MLVRTCLLACHLGDLIPPRTSFQSLSTLSHLDSLTIPCLPLSACRDFRITAFFCHFICCINLSFVRFTNICWKPRMPQTVCYACCSLGHTQSLSRVWLSATLCTSATNQALLSMGFSQKEYWSGLPFPPLEDLPDWGTEPASPESPALAGRFFIIEPSGKSHCSLVGRVNLTKHTYSHASKFMMNLKHTLLVLHYTRFLVL